MFISKNMKIIDNATRIFLQNIFGTADSHSLKKLSNDLSMKWKFWCPVQSWPIKSTGFRDFCKENQNDISIFPTSQARIDFSPNIISLELRLPGSINLERYF